MLTGPAGSGKSYTLMEFIKQAKRKRKKVVVTATTGLAAAHLDGQTIHSWSGMGLGEELPDNYIYTMSEARKKVIRRTDVLIIDEISMMHDYNLDMVNKAMKIIREDNRPFGGIQVILCGDFFQLPPVAKGRDGRFVVDSEAWQELNPSVCYLEEQHRADDLRLQEILNAMRAGKMTSKHLQWLKSCMNRTVPEDITRLYTLNVDVEDINEQKLNALKGDSHYILRTSKGNHYDIQNLQRNVMAPEVLHLKVGARVMAVKNDAELQYANGSIGDIIEFTEDGLPVVLFDSGKVVIVEPQEWEVRKGDRLAAAITQVPLRLAYAITVHKSQGMTLDSAEVDLSKAFVEGMGYVGLSRVKNLDTLFLKGLNQRSLQVSPRAREIDVTLRDMSRSLI